LAAARPENLLTSECCGCEQVGRYEFGFDWLLDRIRLRLGLALVSRFLDGFDRNDVDLGADVHG
jgi:hypothetical protein